MKNKINRTLDVIENVYVSDDKPWYVAYSGGKDSTLVLLLIVEFLKKRKNDKKIHIVYCDTGVEFPIMRDYTIGVLNNLDKIARIYNLPIEILIAKPRIEDSFFVNVIGKGYVPPSFMFRWCTNRLRTRPLQDVTKDKENIILLGTRFDESTERNRTLKSNQVDSYIFRQRSYPNSTIFSPIIDYNVEEVWKSIETLNIDAIIDVEKLKFLYKGFSESNEQNREILGGRYGCWVCTVVRRDKAGENLVKKGYAEINHLLSFRQLLLDLRNDPSKRYPNRKTGEKGKGPFSLDTRKMILERLILTEKQSGYKLIDEEEICFIKHLWENEDK